MHHCIFAVLCLVERAFIIFITYYFLPSSELIGSSQPVVMNRDFHICMVTVFSLKMLHLSTIFSYLNPIPQMWEDFFSPNLEMKY